MQPIQRPELPDELWGEIGNYLQQPELIRTQMALARTGKQLHKVFGGYLFVFDQTQLNQALAFSEGPVKAIVLMPEADGLTVTRVPQGSYDGKPSPIVTYGNTAITAGQLHVHAPVRITASGKAEVWAQEDVTVDASQNAVVWAFSESTVNASGDTLIHALNGSEVHASGNAKVNAYQNSDITVSGQARVKAHPGSTVTGIGSGVIIFAAEDANVTVYDETTHREVLEGVLTSDISFEDLEARYLPQQASDTDSDEEYEEHSGSTDSHYTDSDEEYITDSDGERSTDSTGNYGSDGSRD